MGGRAGSGRRGAPCGSADADGRDAAAIYYGNPVAHNLGLMTHALTFARALRTRNVYSASSADQLPQMLVALRMFGHQALIPVPDLDRTDLLFVFGANPVVSQGSLMTAPDVKRRLRAIRERGGRVVVVDPRRTETADDRRRACRHPAGDRRLAAGGHAPRRVRRGPGSPRSIRRTTSSTSNHSPPWSTSSRRRASLAERESAPKRSASSPSISPTRHARPATAASASARSSTARWRPGWRRPESGHRPSSTRKAP